MVRGGADRLKLADAGQITAEQAQTLTDSVDESAVDLREAQRRFTAAVRGYDAARGRYFADIQRFQAALDALAGGNPAPARRLAGLPYLGVSREEEEADRVFRQGRGSDLEARTRLRWVQSQLP